jgi:hypothetical protein
MLVSLPVELGYCRARAAAAAARLWRLPVGGGGAGWGQSRWCCWARAARGEGLIVGRWRVLLFWMGRQIIIKAGLFIIAGGKS